MTNRDPEDPSFGPGKLYFGERELGTISNLAIVHMTTDEIKDARNSLDMSVTEIAAWLGLEGENGRDLYRAWESGKKPISGPASRAMMLGKIFGRAAPGQPIESKLMLHEPRAKDPEPDELNLVSFQATGGHDRWIVTSTWQVEPEGGRNMGIAYWPVGATIEDRFDSWPAAAARVAELMRLFDFVLIG